MKQVYEYFEIQDKRRCIYQCFLNGKPITHFVSDYVWPELPKPNGDSPDAIWSFADPEVIEWCKVNCAGSWMVFQDDMENVIGFERATDRNAFVEVWTGIRSTPT